MDFFLFDCVPGFLHETVTCCALFILRPVMLIWALSYLKYLKGMLGFQICIIIDKLISKCKWMATY